jgi:hypothetical protein
MSKNMIDIINHGQNSVLVEPTRQIKAWKWCQENLGKAYREISTARSDPQGTWYVKAAGHGCLCYYFLHQEDAMAFMLAWGQLCQK